MLIGQDIRHVENQKSLHTAQFNQHNESVALYVQVNSFNLASMAKIGTKTQVFFINAFLLPTLKHSLL